MRKNNIRMKMKLSAILLSGIFLLTSCRTSSDEQKTGRTDHTELQNPVVIMNECDTVYFGNYWQNDTNGDGIADQNDEKTPIRWRILSKEGNDAYVIADQVLDSEQYNNDWSAGFTWEVSSLRQWLNEEFYNNAFTAEEQKAIIAQTLSNEGEGNDTEDLIFLPTIEDIKNVNYGFSENSSVNDQARSCEATEYVQYLELPINEELNCKWWLRSLGNDFSSIAYVYENGTLNQDGFNIFGVMGVRPVLHLDISSPLVKEGERIETSIQFVSWDVVELGSYDDIPILWRVLEVTDEEVFLLSDQIISNEDFHDNILEKDITWKDCTLRTWLNEEFYNKAFTEKERAGIIEYSYANPDNPWYGTEGGEDTQDKRTLLSLEDIVKKEYGFPTTYSCRNPGRVSYMDDYLGGEGLSWWLRSAGSDFGAIAYVHSDGRVDVAGYWVWSVMENNAGVRPALHFNISTYKHLIKNGSVTVGNSTLSEDTGIDSTETEMIPLTE